jgi:hypothetical protein
MLPDRQRLDEDIIALDHQIQYCQNIFDLHISRSLPQRSTRSKNVLQYDHLVWANDCSELFSGSMMPPPTTRLDELKTPSRETRGYYPCRTTSCFLSYFRQARLPRIQGTDLGAGRSRTSPDWIDVVAGQALTQILDTPSLLRFAACTLST